MEKWFVRSRRLWSAAIPAVVAVWLIFQPEGDPEALRAQLEGMWSALDRAVQAVMLLGSAGAGLWSFLRPDHARLRAMPKTPGS